MSKLLRYCLMLMAALFSRLSWGKEPKSVCQGNSVQMFQNVTLTKNDTVNLYINGLRAALIATWSSNLCTNALNGYKGRVFLDEFGSVSMQNIQLSDEGTYVISLGTNMKSEVKINVMTAPTKYCKPILRKTENLLTAYLDQKECGKPEAYVQWLDYPDISIIGETVVKLPPEKEFGTYYACAESLAQTCVTNFKLSDYCSRFTIEGSNSPAVSSELSSIKTFTLVTVALVSAILFVALSSAIPILIYLIPVLKKKSFVPRQADVLKGLTEGDRLEKSNEGISRNKKRSTGIDGASMVLLTSSEQIDLANSLVRYTPKNSDDE